MKKSNILQIFAYETPQTGVTTEAGVVNTTASSDLAYTIKEHWVPTLLDNLYPNLFFGQYARQEKMPQHRGHKIEFRKWNTIDVTTDSDGDLVTLVEGVTPDPDEIGMNRVEAQVVQFGKWVPITDRLEAEAFDNVILGATEELSHTAAQQKDLYIRQILLGNTDINISYASKKTFGTDGRVTARTAVSYDYEIDDTCILDAYEVHKAVNRMSANNVPKINGCYAAIIHPSVEFDLTESKGWTEAHVYASPEEIYNGEIGKLQGCRFSVTSNAKVYAAGTFDNGESGEAKVSNTSAVYPCFFFGKDGYADIKPDGMTMNMYIKKAENSGTEDPLSQRSTVGYKFSTACAVLDGNRIWRLDCGSSEFGAEDETN